MKLLCPIATRSWLMTRVEMRSARPTTALSAGTKDLCSVNCEVSLNVGNKTKQEYRNVHRQEGKKTGDLALIHSD